MPRVRFTLPEVKRKPDERPSTCPRCGGKGEKAAVGFVTDAERGGLLGIDLLTERDEAGFTEWLSGNVDKLGVKAIVSDDLNAYKPVAEEPGLERQICLAHVRKNVRRRLVVELSDKWRSLTRRKRARGLPETNDCAERVIGRSKIRYKTVRGYKSIEGMMNGLGLTQWVWSGEDGLRAGELVNA